MIISRLICSPEDGIVHLFPEATIPFGMWHIYTMEYYSAIKRNKTELFVVRWMDLESIILSEVSQTEKRQISYDITYMWNVKR